MDHDDDAAWCSINEAARRLRVTPTAIRNRIKRGTLETKPNGNHGRLVRVPPMVILPVPVTGSDTVTGTVTPTVDPLVPELRAQIGHLEARLKATQDELVAMAQKVGAAESEITALQVQAIETKADRDAWRQQAERLAAPAERRSLWERWRQRLAG
jgi:hypothetical protein